MNKTAKNLAHCFYLWLVVLIASPLLFVSCDDDDDKGDVIELGDAVPVKELLVTFAP